ncbi:hypothetical protein ASPTUDRAFT_42815 [Aspergillus tubingensis CBS 134.48]|uniref:Uncharacterized protein n=1 Tax=Aspergillus tubingensis (strain CBS 134.48) TaxID=767770 RepID=A0A1L9N3P8_ASPTC|nr:hypothetical protein ASPTUDRAFT_42815 [Aspergillus tubingensis CBS 134.48]
MKPLPLKIKEYKNEEEARENGEGVDSFAGGMNGWMIIWEKWIWGAQQKTCLVPSGRRSSVEADADPEGKETKKKDLGGGKKING